jgi:putative ABC transport system substrate-binding protein
LGATTPSAQSQWTAAFVQRLREFGWIEGRTIAIEYRWTEGRTERAAEIAAEFVQRKVDVIVTSGTGMVLAAKQATSVIPIVFAATGDPVGTGLVTSLARRPVEERQPRARVLVTWPTTAPVIGGRQRSGG